MNGPFSAHVGVALLSSLSVAACQPSPAPEAAPEPTQSLADTQTPGPAFQVDPFWPQALPDEWLVGNVVGIAVDSHDNVWITHRPNSQPGAENTPPVIALDPDGRVVKSWGGSGEGYQWGTQAHGLYVDYQDNVWVGFGGGLPYDLTTRATTDNAHVLKFTPDGEFLLQIGEFGGGTEGNNSTQFLGQPTDVYVDPETDEAYVTDGYTNRRVIVFDANTGEYKRHWGAYGNEPDDAATIGFDRNGPPPQQFNTPHCIGMANDGLLYVCDRQHERIQVFERDGTFVKEAAITVTTSDGEVGGRPGDLAFSLDPEQRLIYMVDMANAKVHTLERDSLRIVDTFGRRGRMAGQLLTPHSLALDSAGNLYVTETTVGSRMQKFVPTEMN